MAKNQEKARALENACRHEENAQKLVASGMRADALLELNHAVDILARALKTNFCELPPELTDSEGKPEGGEPPLLDVLKTLEENTKNLLTQEDLEMMHKVRKARNNEAHFSAAAGGESYDWVDTACRQMASLLKDRAPSLLYGPAYEPVAARIYYVDTVMDGVNRARKVMDETHVLDAAAIRLGQSLELIARVGVFDCMPAVLGSSLDDSLAAMEYEELFDAEDLWQMRRIQGMRNQAAHASESPLTEQEVRDACNWMENFAYGPLCELLQLDYGKAKQEQEQAQQNMQSAYKRENRKSMIHAGQRTLVNVGYAIATIVLIFAGFLSILVAAGTAGMAAAMTLFVLMSTCVSVFAVSSLPQIGQCKKGIQNFLDFVSGELNEFVWRFLFWDVFGMIGMAGALTISRAEEPNSLLMILCAVLSLMVTIIYGLAMLVRMYQIGKAIRKATGEIEIQEVTDLDVRYRTPEEMKQDLKKIRAGFISRQRANLIMMTALLVVDIIVVVLVIP